MNRKIYQEKLGDSLDEAVSVLKGDGYEHVFDDQWQEITNKLVLAGLDFETVVTVEDDGVCQFDMLAMD